MSEFYHKAISSHLCLFHILQRKNRYPISDYINNYIPLLLTQLLLTKPSYYQLTKQLIVKTTSTHNTQHFSALAPVYANHVAPQRVGTIHPHGRDASHPDRPASWSSLFRATPTC